MPWVSPKPAAAAVAFGPSYASGDLIGTPFITDGSAATVNGRADFAPVFVARSVTINGLVIWVRTLAAASTVRLGLYNDTGSGRPGTLVVDGGTIDSTTTGAKTAAVSKVLAAGTYWAVAQAEGGTPSVDCASNKVPLTVVRDATGTSQGNGFGYTHTGALAADVSAQAWTNLGTPPVVFLQVA